MIAQGPERGADREHHAENPTQCSIVCKPLQQREARHVEHRVADADERQRCQRDDRRGDQPDRRDRQPPQDQAHRHRSTEPATTGETERDPGPDYASHPHRGAEPTDAALAEREEIERDHHEQDCQHAADEELRYEAPHDERERPFMAEDSDSAEQGDHG